MRNYGNNKGVTLIELIIAMSLLTMIIGIAGSLITFSSKSQAAISKEYQIQAEMRIASEIVNQQVRYSSAVFLLNKNQFKDAADRKKGWSYVTLSSDKKEIIHHIWDESADSHTPKTLVQAHDGLLYSLNFGDVINESKLVNFKIDGYFENSGSPKVSIESTLNALNSAVVDDSGTSLLPAVTLAYRLDDIPDADKIKVAVTMVLDKSGSMGFKMGGTGTNKDDVRMTIMKQEASKLIDTFKTMDNVYVSLIPFSTNANSPGDFKKADTPANGSVLANSETLKNSINGLNANGGTNAGDGLRRSYYKHVDFKTGETDQVLNYTILLMDGNPTFWPVKSGSSYYGDGDISSTGGDGNNNTITGSMKYIKDFADMHIKKTDSSQKVFMKTFVIGFTGVPDEVGRAEEIATYNSNGVGSKIEGIYYSAESGNDLAEVFNSIVEYILRDTWHIYGPIPLEK